MLVWKHTVKLNDPLLDLVPGCSNVVANHTARVGCGLVSLVSCPEGSRREIIARQFNRLFSMLAELDEIVDVDGTAGSEAALSSSESLG